jgi:predicted Zn-dependent protease
MVFGQDPRQGFFRGNTFYHPELEFILQFPEGWQTMNQVAAVVGINQDQNTIIELTISQASTAGTAADQFLGQQGISSSTPRTVTVNGLPGVWADFTAQTEQGSLAGSALFVDYGGNIYQIVSYGTQQAWSGNSQVASNSLRSFSQLTDPEILAVEPMRLRIIRLDQPMTIQEFAERYPPPIAVDQLALINRVELTEQLPTGFMVKRVVGERHE